MNLINKLNNYKCIISINIIWIYLKIKIETCIVFKYLTNNNLYYNNNNYIKLIFI